MWYFKKNNFIIDSNNEKNSVLSKIFMIKNNNKNLISFSLLFHHVDLIFTKKMKIFKIFPGKNL